MAGIHSGHFRCHIIILLNNCEKNIEFKFLDIYFNDLVAKFEIMSAVEPCLETTEISETNELMESFETVDEDKDSDEESFHLFLEGDEDHNKSDDKITDDDTNTDNNFGKEEKNQECFLEGELNNERVNIEEKQQDDVDELTTSCNTTDEATLSQKENTEETEVVNASDNSEEKPSENENLASDSITSNNEESAAVIEHSVSETIDEKLEAEAPIENEDDILNKHACENSEEIGNSVEELDPNIEESLLNECDETETDDNPKKSGEVEIETNSSASEVKQTEVTASVVNVKPDKPEQNLPGDSECNGNDRIKEIRENSDKNAVSLSNSQKCDENSSNSSNPDTDDLLDISMIKDSAQDDADIAEDAFQLEQENEESSSKGVENMENIDDSSNSGNSDEDGKAESETSETLQNELSDSEKEKDTPESDKEETETKIDECVNGDNVAENEDSVSSQNCENTTEKAAKRPLSSCDVEPSSKRIRLVETYLDDTEMDSWDITELQSLISFSKFMTKSHLKKLTRTDLEEFCIQKLCEAILHKSELGETNHQLKIQEQTIETLRREQAVITKQIKDLEIVNKKLMHEILASNGLKPILPVKITRSVGLQVRLPGPNDTNAVKRRSLPTPNKGPVPQNQANAAKVRVTPNANPNRVVTQPSPQKQTTPILNTALRTRTPLKSNNIVQRPPIAPKQAPPEKRQRTSGSFIDLTDEDDKRTNKTNPKSMVPQGVRINTVPKTTISNMLPTVVTTSTTPQLMYVVQPNSQLKQGVLTTSAGQKAVLLNFQPSNGVINTLNNSSVSVIPKISATPLKPKPTVQNSSLLKANKHPAPLPCPPAVQGPNDKSLKAIPPRPVLSIRKTTTGIILQWRMPYDLRPYEPIASYQLFAYQETCAVPNTEMWKKVGDVKAMALPMACTLTQFVDKNKYYFAVRPVDIHKRIGKFSHPVLSE